MSILVVDPPRLVRRIGVLTAATAAVAPTLVAGLAHTASAAPASATSPSQAAAASGSNASGCTTDDGKLVESQAITAPNGVTYGEVRLYYSPSSRCVWGSAESNSNVEPCCVSEGQVDVWVDRAAAGESIGSAEVHAGTGRGQRKAITIAISDSFTTSYARGQIDAGNNGVATGKTASF
jgi:hypothetical protein